MEPTPALPSTLVAVPADAVFAAVGAAVSGAAPLMAALNEVSEVPDGIVSARLLSMNDQRTSPPIAIACCACADARSERTLGTSAYLVASAESAALRAV